jgi:hypothetical protein
VEGLDVTAHALGVRPVDAGSLTVVRSDFQGWERTLKTIFGEGTVQRTSIIGEIFGYLVCLLAVVIFFMSIAGIVNSAFRIGNPAAGPQVFGARMIGGPMMRAHFPRGGNFFYRTGGPAGGRGQRGGQVFAPAPPMPMPLPSGAPVVRTMRATFVGDARLDAVRRLVLAIVMLFVSILVFRRTFDWLNAKQATGGGS